MKRHDARFQLALAAKCPITALNILAKELRDEGMTEKEMYALFESHRKAHGGDADETLLDAITDTMDNIVGFCSEHNRIFTYPPYRE